MKRLNFFILLITFLCSAFGQAPANDSCQNAFVLTPGINPIFDTVQVDGATSDLTGCGRNEDIWFKFEMPATGGIRIETQRVDLNWKPFIRLYEGACGSFTAYACEGKCQYWSSSNCSDELLLNDSSLAGDTLYIRMSKRFSHSGVRGAIRILELNAGDFPSNDSCGAAIDVTANLYTSTSDSFTLKNAIAELSSTSCGTDEDIWVKFEVPTSGGFKIQTQDFNNGWNPFIEVYENGCNSTRYACDGTCQYFSAVNCGNTLQTVDPSIAGDSLWVKISNQFNSDIRDSFSINLTEIATTDFVPNDSCPIATDLTSIISVKRDTFTLEYSTVESTFQPCGTDEDVWFEFTVPSSGGFEIETYDLNNGWDPFFSLFTGSCSSLDMYACDGHCQYYSASDNCGSFLRVVDTSLVGETMLMRLSNRFGTDIRDDFSIRIDSIATANFSPNDSCEIAIDMTPKLGLLDTFTMANCGVEAPSLGCGQPEDVWFKFEVPSSGAFELQTKDVGNDWWPYSKIYTGGCASLASYDCQSENCNKLQTDNCGDFLRVVDSTLAGDTVWVRVAHRFGGDPLDEKTIEVNPIGAADLQANDDCVGAQMLQVNNGSCSIDTFSNANTTYSSVPTSTCGSYSGGDVWFSFIMPSSDDVFLELSQATVSPRDFRVTAFSGGCNALSEQVCNASGDYPSLSIRNLGLVGDTVLVHVYITNSNVTGDSFGICLKDTVTPPLRTVVGQYEKTTNCPSINGSGWFDLIDTTGSLVASIDPTGNNLGRICYGVNIEDSASSPRTATDTVGGTAFLSPRNYYLSPQFTNISANVRLYFKERELAIWRDSLAAAGESVGPNLQTFYQDSMRISKMDGGSLTNYLGGNPVQINPTVTLVRDSIVMAEFSVTSFSNFVPVFNPGSATAPIPVEWLRFDGIKEDGLVKLEWATASELNCSHFEVKESFDGRTFNTIGIVEGNGTVNSISEYRFNHRSPSNRKAYYMLKQIDYDGTFDYSKVVAIKAQTSVLVSPNPFRDEITVSAGSEEIRKIELLDLYGRTVYTKEVNATSVKLDLHTEMEHGVYILRIITETEVLERKIIKE